MTQINNIPPTRLARLSHHPRHQTAIWNGIVTKFFLVNVGFAPHLPENGMHNLGWQSLFLND
jgi:hypothetical protein